MPRWRAASPSLSPRASLSATTARTAAAACGWHPPTHLTHSLIGGKHRIATEEDNGPLAPLLQVARTNGKLPSGASDERLMAHVIYVALSFSLARSIIPAEWCAAGCSYGAPFLCALPLLPPPSPSHERYSP